MAKVFVSYSRKNIEFAKRLTAELQKSELDFWIDWEGIPPTVDWWREIEKGIEEADVFLFLISPDSAKSKVCGQEIDVAVKNGKRIIPIVVRDIAWEDTPKHLGHLNYIFFRESDDFNAGVNKLMTAIQTDYEWAATHRRLQVKALEWERNHKENSFLLRGKDLQEAELQLATNSSKEPHPTDLRRKYVFSSRKAVDKQRRITTGISIVGIISLAALALFGFYQAGLATNNEKRALSNASTAQAASTLAVSNAATAVANEHIARAGELAAQSISMREKDFQISLLLGVEAFRLSDTVQTHGALRDATNTKPQLLQFLAKHKASVSSVAFSPDGRNIASGSIDGTIILWNAETYQPIGQPFLGHTDSVSSVAYSPDGKTLASGSFDGAIILWDTVAHQAIGHPFIGYPSQVLDIAFSADGKTIAARSKDSTLSLWDMTTLFDASGTIRQPESQLISGHITSLAFSPNSSVLALGVDNGTIDLWDIERNESIGEPLGSSSGFVTGVTFSPDGTMLASVSENTIMLWDVESHQVSGQQIIVQSGAVSSIAFHPNGKVLASGAFDGTILLWDLATRQPVGQSLIGSATSISSIAFSPNGKFLASGNSNSTIALWDVQASLDSDLTDQKSGIAQSLSGYFDSISTMAFTSTANLVALGSYENPVTLWDIESHKSVDQIMPESTESLAFSPDGKTMAYIRDDGDIILWDVKSKQHIGHPLTGHTGGVTSVTFCPNGKILASGHDDGTIIFWDLDSQTPIGQPLKGDAFSVSSVAFSPDEQILASASFDDNTIVIWNVETRQPMGQPLNGHLNLIYSLAFSPDGKFLASGSYDQSIILWDMETRQPVGQPFTGFGEFIQSLSFNSDGKILASLVDQQKIILWNMDPVYWINQSCQRAGRNFTRAEWERYFSSEKYRKTCNEWPPPPERISTPTP